MTIEERLKKCRQEKEQEKEAGRIIAEEEKAGFSIAEILAGRRENG